MLIWSPGGVGEPANDGTLMGSSSMMFRGEPGERVVGERYLVRYSSEGDSLQSLGPFEVETTFPHLGQDVRLSGPYPRQFFSTPRNGGVFVADSPYFEIKQVSFEGGL